MSQVTLRVTRCEAISVLMSCEICATATPNSAGTMSWAMRRVGGSAQAAFSSDQVKPMRGSMPMRISVGICTPNCNIPPNITPPQSA